MKSINELLEKINQQLRDADPSQLSKLEIDLVKQHLRELYDKLDSSPSNTEKKEIKHAIPSEETLQPEALIRTKTISKEHIVLNDVDEPTKEEQAILEAEAHEKKSSKLVKASLNERVQSSSSLNEKLKRSDKEVHKKLSTKPLKALIDLNQRFVLLNELFQGNSEVFTSTVDHIDGLNDYSEAQQFIKNQLASNHFWNESSPSVKLFNRLVKQKFGVE